MTAKKQYGDLSVKSTGSNIPMLAGNVVALLSPIIFIPVLTFAFGPQNYDYKSMAAIRLGNDEDIAAAAHTDLELIPGAVGASPEQTEIEQKKLRHASIIAKSMTGFMTLALLILWPMPMYGSSYVFSKKFFTGWVSVGILWLFCSTLMVGVFPLWEGRHSMKNTFLGIVRDLRGRNGISVRNRVIEGRQGSVTGSDAGVEKRTEIITEKAS